jgi:hypothetical protein
MCTLSLLVNKLPVVLSIGCPNSSSCQSALTTPNIDVFLRHFVPHMCAKGFNQAS